MSKFRSLARVGAAALLLATAACGDDSNDDDNAAPERGAGEDASVEFITPSSGDEVTSPVEVEMAAEGLDIVEAGAPAEGEGHFHVMVDTGCHFDVGEIIPDDEAHLHFGDGSTTAEIELDPGEHTLCLQAGDGTHAVLDANQEIDITVVE